MPKYGRGLILLALAIWLVLGSNRAFAQALQAVANVQAERTEIEENWLGRRFFRLGLSQPVPYRVAYLEQPNRMVLDFQSVDWTALPREKLAQSPLIKEVLAGVVRPGWSRLVLVLETPIYAQTVEMKTEQAGPEAVLELKLGTLNPLDFSKIATQELDQDWTLAEVVTTDLPKKRPLGDRKPVIIIDAGHGGFDSGASFKGYKEKDIVLGFSKELQEALIRSGRFDARLTRRTDRFVALPSRIAIARALEGDVLLSIHADAVAEGRASGTTIYTLSDKASDQSTAQLAAQLDRADLLAGVDLSFQDDAIAQTLMDLARLETNDRSENLAAELVTGISASIGHMRARPHLSASFSVLRAPDIPSVLIELGFINNPKDLNLMLKPEWREEVITGILAGLDSWSLEDAAQAKLLRQ